MKISDSGEIKVDEDGRLIIEKVKHQDAGKYTCVAENTAGRTEKSIELIVTSKLQLLLSFNIISMNTVVMCIKVFTVRV